MNFHVSFCGVIVMDAPLSARKSNSRVIDTLTLWI